MARAVVERAAEREAGKAVAVQEAAATAVALRHGTPGNAGY